VEIIESKMFLKGDIINIIFICNHNFFSLACVSKIKISTYSDKTNNYLLAHYENCLAYNH